MVLELVPVDFATACAFVNANHRHHAAPVGWKFGVGVADAEGNLVGVAMASRPVSRMLDDGNTLEVTRCCTDGAKNAASKLYGALARAARALGYRRIVTYTLKDETGISVVSAGWKKVWETRGGSWSCPSRPRKDKHPTGQKVLWEA